MQSFDLTIDKFLEHAARWHGRREVVWAEAGVARDRTGYADLRERANLLSGALVALGLDVGDRVATLAWNTRHHFETYFGTMGVGLVCHTLNPRFTAAHLAAIVNEAGDRVLAVASNLVPLARELVGLCPCIEHVVVMDDADAPIERMGARTWTHDGLIEDLGAPIPWGAFDEHAIAGLCYTSGTTGAPKGVPYTHRSNYLHTLRALQADAMGIAAEDCVLVGVPMFHANSWGLPFAAPAVGAKLVLPGRQADGASLARLMRGEGVTIAAGVQTLWLGVIDHLEASGEELPDLKRVMIGGSPCPDALIHRMEDRLGAQVQTTWGMTELSPLGVIAPPGSRWSPAQGSGRTPMGLDLRLTDADGHALPEQRGHVGHLKVKGPSVVERYYLSAETAVDADGWFDTGDLASIDDDGYVSIQGRAKDLIKSGGEWINPIEIEAIVARHPGVRLVAVVGRPDEKWGERPVLVFEAHAGCDVEASELAALLDGKVASWWMPERFVRVEAMPLAATGKIDKMRIRAEHAGNGAPPASR